jgi:hypothetical protein
VANQVSKFTTDCNIEPSAITETNGNVGIGLAPSAYKLDVGGPAIVRGTGFVVAPKIKGVTFPVTDISGCLHNGVKYATIAFAGQTACQAALASDGTNTYLAVGEKGGQVQVSADLVGKASASFFGSGSFGSSLTVSSDVLIGGTVQIDGDLNVHGQKNFQIDDPLDPANRYLYHSAVESSEMMNIYTGNVTTNEHGDATVQVPAWFEALNGDFRYQLTVIGQFAQAIVASEIRDSKFSIKTDKPSVKVSWQVTGVRQDAYAKAHPLVVEQDKQASERGYYLHPELFGQPRTKGINYARQHPAPVKEAEAGRAGQAN